MPLWKRKLGERRRSAAGVFFQRRSGPHANLMNIPTCVRAPKARSADLSARPRAAIKPAQDQPGFIVSAAGPQPDDHLSPQFLAMISRVVNQLGHPQRFDIFFAERVVKLVSYIVAMKVEPGKSPIAYGGCPELVSQVQPIRCGPRELGPMHSFTGKTRLGELTWLGPASVVVFGFLLGLIANAFYIQKFDRWMLLLVLGTFTGAYPLMYFAQEFIPLNAAIAISSAIVIVIIAIRSMTIMSVRLALLGIVLSAVAVLALTIVAANVLNRSR